MTKYQSTICKGIAILMMLFHHLFYVQDRVMHYNVSFWPISQGKGIAIGMFCKVCVAIFAFISGYGYCKKSVNAHNYLRKTAKRLLKLMFQFWFVFLIFFVIGVFTGQSGVYITGNVFDNLKNLLVDFAGLAYYCDTPTLNRTWWYISLALLFIVVSPLLVFLSKKKSVSILIIVTLIIGLHYSGGCNRIWNTCYYLLTLECGIIISNYQIFEKISRLFNNKKILDLAVFSIALLGLIYLRLCWFYIFAIDTLIAATICYIIFRITTIKQSKKNILFIFGKYSTNMFLLHTFIYYVYFTDFIYSPKYFLAIWILLTIIALALAYLIEKIKKTIKYDIVCKKLLNRI